jgi:HSP20 family protein
LEGKLTDHHRFLLKLLWKELAQQEELIAELDGKIEEFMRPFVAEIERLDAIPGVDHRVAFGPVLRKAPRAPRPQSHARILRSCMSAIFGAGHVIKSREAKMQTQGSAMQVQPAEESVKVRIGGLTDDLKETLESVARHAFDIFERKGRALGHALADWLEAEAQMLHPVRLELSESDESYTIHAEVPGFSSQQLDVRVEPRKLTLTGKREIARQVQAKRIYSELRSDRILRTVDLPAEVDMAKAQATLKDGILRVELLKTSPAKRVPIETKAA